MFRAIILSIFKNTRLCVNSVWFNAPKILPADRAAASWVHYTTNCNTQSSVPENEQNNYPKRVELTGIINKPLLLHLVGCLHYLCQWCTVKQISDNKIYLLIEYIKSVLGRVAKRLSCTEDARCLKVNVVPALPMKSCRATGCTAPLTRHLGASSRWVTDIESCRFNP